jgi:hypothetical protein
MYVELVANQFLRQVLTLQPLEVNSYAKFLCMMMNLIVTLTCKEVFLIPGNNRMNP